MSGYGFTFRLEYVDGTPTDPPSFSSSPGTAWSVGDTLHLGRRTLRVVDVRDGDADELPVLVVEDRD